METMKPKNQRLSKEDIWEKHLFYSFIPMVKMYVQLHVLGKYMAFLDEFNDSPKSKEVLEKVALLHLHNTIITQEGFFRDVFDRDQIEELRESCLQLNKDLRPEIVALTFTLPFRDSGFGAIGKSSMQPYKEFMKGVKETPGCFGKPKEWKYLYQSKM